MSEIHHYDLFPAGTQIHRKVDAQVGLPAPVVPGHHNQMREFPLSEKSSTFLSFKSHSAAQTAKAAGKAMAENRSPMAAYRYYSIFISRRQFEPSGFPLKKTDNFCIKI